MDKRIILVLIAILSILVLIVPIATFYAEEQEKLRIQEETSEIMETPYEEEPIAELDNEKTIEHVKGTVIDKRIAGPDDNYYELQILENDSTSSWYDCTEELFHEINIGNSSNWIITDGIIDGHTRDELL